MVGLNGLSILVPESRELNLLARMLEEQGAIALRCPLVRIAELEDLAPALAWIDAMIQKPFDLTVLLTGEGLRHLVRMAGERAPAFIAALGQGRTVTRGPKPARALREIGLAPSLAADEPTSQGILKILETENLAGARVGIQLYPGDGAGFLIPAVAERGADVFAVTPYRYANDTETARVAEAITDLVEGRTQMVVFTSKIQIERLFAVATEQGRGGALLGALHSVPIAAVGPVVEEALKAHGLSSAISPERNFHLKPLVRAIGEYWSAP